MIETEEAVVAARLAICASRELEDDYVGFWQLVGLVQLLRPDISGEKLRNVVQCALSALVSEDVLLGDLEADFVPWVSEDPVGRAMSDWTRLGRNPTIGEVGWLCRPN